ncbi:hypothetical protein MA1A_gp04 [Pectobacterium phage MA1A]|nr:hypothetical protein MA6_gp17 [Pectobacterium phage MA6]QGH45301.1 hypothetical protein MA1A_gp04 [Pectobacterium phage MA1A]
MSLKQIQHLLENPNDAPDDIPRVIKEYLQVVLNYSYLRKSGQLSQLKSAGYSEEYILGFLAGCEHGSQVIDNMEIRKNMEG